MNTFKKIIFAISIPFIGSCTKEKLAPGAASLSIIHAVVGADNIRTNFKGKNPINYFTANQIHYGDFGTTSNQFSLPIGKTQLGLFQMPDTLASDEPFYLLDLDLQPGSVNTLFLTGTAESPESLIIKENLPFYAAGDSTVGFRFIHLGSDQGPISVNLVDKTNGSEITNLAYKAYSDFKRYPVKKGMADYVFEFRHATTGELIASYTAYGIGEEGTIFQRSWAYRNFTLALIGKADGTGPDAPAILLILHSDT